MFLIVQLNFMSFNSAGPRRDVGLDDVVVDKCDSFCKYMASVFTLHWQLHRACYPRQQEIT